MIKDQLQQYIINNAGFTHLKKQLNHQSDILKGAPTQFIHELFLGRLPRDINNFCDPPTLLLFNTTKIQMLDQLLQSYIQQAMLAQQLALNVNVDELIKDLKNIIDNEQLM